MCCGAATKPKAEGDLDTSNTVLETCQLKEATTYTYKPAYDSVAETWPFVCIEGATKLVGAIAAVSSILYSLN